MKRAVLALAGSAAIAWGCVNQAEAGQSDAAKSNEKRDEVKMDRVLFLGNSITLHGPNAEIGWTNNCGMAASALEKDYVHLVIGKIAASRGKEPAAMVENAADFERQYATFNTAPLVKKCADFKPDIIILAIGENVPGLGSDDAKAKFKTTLTSLLKALKAEGNPKIFVRSSFWADKTKDTIMQEICKDVGGIFVDISRLGSDESNFARSERKIPHEGVARHPGDKGMKAIADAIWSAIADAARTTRAP